MYRTEKSWIRSSCRVLLWLFLLCLSPTLHADEIAGNAQIIDGDTIKIWGVSIRLEGIDAPELGQVCKYPSGGQWACGEDAADRLKNRLAGKSVRCVGDEKDQYKRLIATCYVGNTNLNQLLVSEGWAVAFLRFSDSYAQQERSARSAKLGIWGSTFIRPVDFRAGKWEESKESSKTETASTKCSIKGNINSKGVKIYHTPWGSRWYKKTKINTAKGEQWYCTEAEALAAGWRAPLR